MEATREVRGTNSRYLRDGTPNPAYVVEWVGALHVDFILCGALSVKKEVVKQVEGLRNRYLKFYCKFAKILASQTDYTVAMQNQSDCEGSLLVRGWRQLPGTTFLTRPHKPCSHCLLTNFMRGCITCMGLYHCAISCQIASLG